MKQAYTAIGAWDDGKIVFQHFVAPNVELATKIINATLRLGDAKVIVASGHVNSAEEEVFPKTSGVFIESCKSLMSQMLAFAQDPNASPEEVLRLRQQQRVVREYLDWIVIEE